MCSLPLMETRRAKGDMIEATHFGSAFFASTLRAIIDHPSQSAAQWTAYHGSIRMCLLWPLPMSALLLLANSSKPNGYNIKCGCQDVDMTPPCSELNKHMRWTICAATVQLTVVIGIGWSRSMGRGSGGNPGASNDFIQLV